MGSSTSAALRSRIRTLEASLARIEHLQNQQAVEFVSVATCVAQRDTRAYIQNTTIATVHMARPNDGGHIVCGWRFVCSHKEGVGPPYRAVDTLVAIPWHMFCGRCWPSERAIARGASCDDELLLSGDD